MGIFEIISAIVLIIACVFIVIVVLMQDTKTQMSQTISGNTGDNYFGKNSGRTKEAQLNKAMIAAAIIFFILAMVVNVANAYFAGSKSDDTSSSVTSSVASEVSSSAGTAEDSGTAESGAAGGTAETSGTADTGSHAESAADSGSADSAASTAEQ